VKPRVSFPVSLCPEESFQRPVLRRSGGVSSEARGIPFIAFVGLLM